MSKRAGEGLHSAACRVNQASSAFPFPESGIGTHGHRRSGKGRPEFSAQ